MSDEKHGLIGQDDDRRKGQERRSGDKQKEINWFNLGMDDRRSTTQRRRQRETVMGSVVSGI